MNSMTQPLSIGHQTDTPGPHQQRPHRLQQSINQCLVVAGNQHQAVTRFTGEFIRPAHTTVTGTPDIGNQCVAVQAELLISAVSLGTMDFSMTISIRLQVFIATT